MLYDKRMLYETDIRVPFVVRGPNIRSGQVLPHAVNHVDIAPTILDMAGVPVPPIMDGHSWLPVVQGTGSRWRTSFMVEYSGGNPLPNERGEEVGAEDSSTVSVSVSATSAEVQAEDDAFAGSLPVQRTSSCSASADDELSLVGKCSCSIGRISGHDHDINPCDGKNNTYACVRTMDGNGTNTMYCEFNDPEQHVELYDLDKDPYNMYNLVAQTSPDELSRHHEFLLKFQQCEGSQECFV